MSLIRAFFSVLPWVILAHYRKLPLTRCQANGCTDLPVFPIKAREQTPRVSITDRCVESSKDGHHIITVLSPSLPKIVSGRCLNDGVAVSHFGA